MPDITSYATATIARQIKPIENAITERNEVLKMLKKKGRIKYGVGGDSIKWRVFKSRGNVFGSTTDWATRSAQTQQPFEVAEVRYAQYDGMITLNEFQMMRNKKAGAEAKMFDMLAEEMKIFKESAADRVGRHVYDNTALTGDQGTNINDLDSFISTSNTYAGISQTANTWWRAQTASVSNPEVDVDANDVPELLEGMRALYLDCSGGKAEGVLDDLATEKEEPDFICTTKAVYLNYENCLTPQTRYTSTSSRDPQASLLFHNTPIMWDTYCPAGKMWFLNSKHLQIDCCSDELLNAPEKYQAVPVQDRNACTWKLIAQFQFYSKNPRYLGVLTVS